MLIDISACIIHRHADIIPKHFQQTIIVPHSDKFASSVRMFRLCSINFMKSPRQIDKPRGHPSRPWFAILSRESRHGGGVVLTERYPCAVQGTHDILTGEHHVIDGRLRSLEANGPVHLAGVECPIAESHDSDRWVHQHVMQHFQRHVRRVLCQSDLI